MIHFHLLVLGLLSLKLFLIDLLHLLLVNKLMKKNHNLKILSIKIILMKNHNRKNHQV